MRRKQNAIVLKAARRVNVPVGVVRLSDAADLSVRCIVSEITIQAEKPIKIDTDDLKQ